MYGPLSNEYIFHTHSILGLRTRICAQGISSENYFGFWLQTLWAGLFPHWLAATLHQAKPQLTEYGREKSCVLELCCGVNSLLTSRGDCHTLESSHKV